MNISTISMDQIEGFPVLIPNKVADHKDFYISYNNYDINTYGCDTTALVIGQMERFFILKGDHRKAYDKLADHGFKACLKYFFDNIDAMHRFSDIPSVRDIKR